MFGRAILCSDAFAEAARYGFTAVDRPDSFLFLGIVSLREKFTEISTVPEVSAIGMLIGVNQKDNILEFPSINDAIVVLSLSLTDAKKMEEEKVSVKGLGRKRPEELGHFQWGDNIKVPCGWLVASEQRDSPVEYNEYAVYDPKQPRVTSLSISLSGVGSSLSAISVSCSLRGGLISEL